MTLKAKSILFLFFGAVAIAGATFFWLQLNIPSIPALTVEEENWLAQHADSIRIAPLPDSAPIDFIDEEGVQRGLTSDYARLLEAKLGINFKILQCNSWEEILGKLKNREVDVVGSIQKTKERQSFLDFTAPYLKIANVIITRKDMPADLSIDNLAGRRIAIVGGSATYDLLKTRYPDYIFVPVKDAATGLWKLSFSEVDCMVADMGVASFHIKELSITNLRVADDIDYPWELCFASRNDWPLLNSILNKALNSVTTQQHRQIRREWITLNNAQILPPDHFLRITGLILLLALVTSGGVIVRNRILHRQVSSRTKELGRVQESHAQTAQALGQSEARFRTLVESSDDMFWEIDPFGNYTYASPRVFDILGYRSAQVVGQSAFSFMIPSDGASGIEQLRQAKAGSVIQRSMNTHIHQDGSHVILESSGRAFTNSEGELAGFRGVSRNITDQMEAEAAVKASEERFRSLVETTSDWIWEVDAQGRFIYVSPQVSAILGYAPTLLIGRRLTDMMDSASAAHAQKLFQDALENGLPIVSLISTNAHKNGNDVVLETSAVPFYDEGWSIIGYRGISRNITERIAAEKQLEFERNLFRSYMANAPHLTFFKDRDGRFIEVNQAKADELAREPDELIGRTDHDFFPEAQAERMRQDELQAMQSGKPVQKEERVTTPNGERWYLTTKVARHDENGAVTGTFGTSWNITDRKMALTELRRLRTMLANIIDSMPSTLIGVDPDGRITQWNREAERITDIAKDDAVGQLLADAFPQLASQMPRVKTAIREHRPQKAGRIPIPQDDHPRVTDITVYPLLGDEEEGAVIRVDDVTERVRMEEMMVQTEKMMSVGGLAAGMAHEINNPLAGILQNMQVMRNRLTQDTGKNLEAAHHAGTTFEAIAAYMDQRGLIDMVESVIDAGRRAAKIVDNMLSFSRRESADYTPNDLVDILERSVELASNDYNLKKRYDFRHITIERSYDESIPAVPCEQSQIQQVVMNLLANSAQAMNEHPVPDRKPSISIRLKKRGSFAQIDVEDNGPGMDETTRKRVFEPFFTTKDVGSGTGLGLSVSYFIIAENHGGSMQVSSSPGHGTCFTIRLPIKALREEAS